MAFPWGTFPNTHVEDDIFKNHCLVWFLDLDLELAKSFLNGFCKPTATRHKTVTRDPINEIYIPLGYWNGIMAWIASPPTLHRLGMPQGQILQTRVLPQ